MKHEEQSGQALDVADRRGGSLSLLPTSLIELCDIAGCPLLSQPLPQTIILGSAHLSLAALNLCQVGDLGAVTPLSLLALAETRLLASTRVDDIWPQALAATAPLIAPILEHALLQPLTQTFALPHFTNGAQNAAQESMLEPALPGQPSQSPYSALFFAPEETIKALWPSWSPELPGLISVPDLSTSIPSCDGFDEQAPLLSSAVQRALVAMGCDLSEKLDTLALNIRTLNCCRKAGFRGLDDLVSQTPRQLFEYRNFGPKSYLDVVSALRTYLALWLAHLPAPVIAGAEHGAEPETPEAAPDDSIRPDDPFAALRDSDLVAALDLYGVPWRDIPVGSLAPKNAGKPLAEAGASESVEPSRPTSPGVSSPLEVASGNLRELMRHLAALGLDPALADLPAGALLDNHANANANANADANANAAAAAIVAHIAPGRVACILDEMVGSLTSLLLGHLLRRDAFRETNGRALAALHRVTIADLLTELLGVPDDQEARSRRNGVDILYARKGLHDGKPQTLDEIGRRVGITRERIRQVANKAYERLENPQSQPLTQALGCLVALAMRALGGVASLADTAAQLGAWIPFGAVHSEAATRFMAEWRADVTITKDGLLIAQPNTEALVRQTQRMLHELVLRQADITREDLLAQVVPALCEQGIAVDERFVAAVLATTTHIREQDERYQPVGRGAKVQRIAQAMRSLGRPAKVAEIGAEYRRLYPDDSQCTDNSIRGFFDRFHELFVVVGMSAYALAEWGYDPRINAIAALVEHILEESDRPLEREEVVERATDRYFWKAQSIRAQLETNERIQRFGGGYFGMRGRDYGAFALRGVADEDGENAEDDADSEGGEQARGRKLTRERLVAGIYTNHRGRRVVRVRLTARSLGGYLPLTSQPLREIFPDVGKFRAEVWPVTDDRKYLTISRAGHDISGLRAFFDAASARAGDALFIERLAGATSDAPALYRLALASADHLAEAMDAVGLDADADARGAATSDVPVLYYTRKPYRLSGLIEHAVAHPWMPLSDVNVALNCLPGALAGQEYFWLAQATGMVATGQPRAGGPTVVRPTALGRRWAFTPESAWERGRALALSLPVYRAHLRALGGVPPADDHAGVAAQHLGERVLAAWDRVCEITSGASALRALEERPAVCSTGLLVGPALPLLLLLLMAQAQGQGIALNTLGATLGGEAQAALQRLRALGLAVAEDASNRIALAECGSLAVASPTSVAATLQTSVSDERIASALAQAWQAALRAVAYRRPLRASDLYDEFHALAPDFLYTMLATAPATTPEDARDVDMELSFSGFPMLAGDWALTPLNGEFPHAGKFWTVIAHSSGAGGSSGSSGSSAAPVGVALCGDLLGQPWDAEQHLAGNAHLALLVVIAADEERLAEQLGRSASGWRLAGDALVPALDRLLSALGYDVWSEGYRHDPGQQTRLGDSLVALAERLHLMVVDGARLEAVSGLATRVYYEACDQGFIGQLTATLNGAFALA